MGVIMPSTINTKDGAPLYDAETLRRNETAAYVQDSPGVARTGVLGASPAVSLSGSTVRVGAFSCVIGTSKGGYVTGVDTVTNAEGTVVAADPTNPRQDRIVLEVMDPDNGWAGTERRGRLRVINGEASALPSLPTMPANAIHLARVNVPKAGGGNPTVTVNCPLTAAAGAPIPVRDQADRDALKPATGQLVQRLDRLGSLEMWNGSRWGEVGTLMRAGYKAVTTNPDGYCTVGYTEPFPGGTTVAIPVSMNPPGGMTLIRFISGEKGGANFFVTATTGEPLRNALVAIGYIAVGF